MEHGYLPTVGVQVLSATVSEQAGRWYVSVQVQVPQDHAAVQVSPTPTRTGLVVGVDLRIRTLAPARMAPCVPAPAISSGGSRPSSGSTGW